jgi:hypothetical protein
VAAILVISGTNIKAFADTVQDHLEDSLSTSAIRFTSDDLDGATVSYRIIGQGGDSGPTGPGGNCNALPTNP